jgi:four helix bundle protein
LNIVLEIVSLARFTQTDYISLLFKNFSMEEKYGVVSQIRQSAISICSNIAEGSLRNSIKDQAHFYTMAYSNLIEILNQIIILYDSAFINSDSYEILRKDIE